MKMKKVLEHVDEEEVVRLTSELVKIPSITIPTKEYPEGERNVARYLADYWRKMGLEVAMQWWERDRPNVIGTLKGTGDGLSLLFTGHMDQTNPGKWKEAFSGEIDREGGRIIGVGSNNMKGPLAAYTIAVKAIIDSGVRLKGDVKIAAVGGECSGIYGSKFLMDSGVTADMCVNGEPTDFILMTAHSGALMFDLETIGKHGHHSRRGRPGAGVDAIEKMFKIYSQIMGDNIRKTFTYKKHPIVGEPLVNASTIHGAPSEPRAPTWFAERCKIEVEMRTVPGMTPETVMKDLERLIERLRKEDPEFEAEVEIWPRSYHLLPVEVSPDEYIVKAVLKAHKQIFGSEPRMRSDPSDVVQTSKFISDACNTVNVGKIPTVLYGSGPMETVGGAECQSIPMLINQTKVYAFVIEDVCSREQTSIK